MRCDGGRGNRLVRCSVGRRGCRSSSDEDVGSNRSKVVGRVLICGEESTSKSNKGEEKKLTPAHVPDIRERLKSPAVRLEVRVITNEAGDAALARLVFQRDQSRRFGHGSECSHRRVEFRIGLGPESNARRSSTRRETPIE